MNYDKDKIDEYTLALLYLVIHERVEGLGARAWKGFDWDTLNRLHEKGYITNPVGKAKSIGMTEEGFLKAEELFKRKLSHSLNSRLRQRNGGNNYRNGPEKISLETYGAFSVGQKFPCDSVKERCQAALSC